MKMVTATEIAEKIGLNPCHVRNRLTRLREQSRAGEVKVGNAWTYPESTIELVANYGKGV